MKMQKSKMKPNYAGGWPAIKSSLEFVHRYLGWLKGTRLLLKLNQKDGFDCPGCAWPDPKHRSPTEFCENGVKAIAEEAMTRTIDGQFFSRWSIDELRSQTDYWFGQSGRLAAPVYKPQGGTHFQRISWESAFEKIGEKLNQLASPHEAAFYTSGRTSNEAAFLYQLMVRVYGTNNLPDCSNMCHESSGCALSESIGIGKGTVSIEDIESSKCVIVMGQNPGTNHPRMLSSLKKTVENGGKIISINPMFEAGTKAFIHPQEPTTFAGKGTALAHLHIPIRINGDLALLKGLMKCLIESFPNYIDHGFVASKVDGFVQYKNNIKNIHWEDVEAGSGVSRETVEELAQLIADSPSLIVCWAMGLTQHKNSVATIQEIVNLLLLGGHFGKSGSGACPVRGHSNVQGDRTMGIWEAPKPEFLKSLEKKFDLPMPSEHGFNTVKTLEAIEDGRVKVFVAMGGNYLSAGPDLDRAAMAMDKLDMSLHVSTKLNRTHLYGGQETLILPCLGRTEVDQQADGFQFVTVENSMGIVHRSQGQLEPSSSLLKSEIEIVCKMSQELFKNRPEVLERVPWADYFKNYDLIRDHIEATIPGFNHYNQRVRQADGFLLPNPPRDKREFHGPNGKAKMIFHPMDFIRLHGDEFLLMTIRSHDQYNTTIYGLNDRYRGVYNQRKVVFMNSADMKIHGFNAYDKVDVHSHFEGKTRKVSDFTLIPYELPPQCLASYFPETNPLVPLESYADVSETPTSKSLRVTLHRVNT